MAWDAGAVTGSLGLDLDGFTSSILKAEGLAALMPRWVTDFMVSPLLGITSAAEEAGHALIHAIGETATHALDIGLAAEKAGTSVKFFSSWSEAAKHVDLTSQDLSTTLRFLNQNIAELASGDAPKQVAGIFQSIGISQEWASQHLGDTEAIFNTVREGIRGITDEQQRTFALHELLSRAGPNSANLFKMDDATIQQWMEVGRQLGVIVDDQAVKTAKSFHDMQIAAKDAWEGIEIKLSEPFLDYISAHTPQIIDDLTKIQNAVGNFAADPGVKELAGDFAKLADEVARSTAEIIKAAGHSASKFQEARDLGLPASEAMGRALDAWVGNKNWRIEGDVEVGRFNAAAPQITAEAEKVTGQSDSAQKLKDLTQLLQDQTTQLATAKKAVEDYERAWGGAIPPGDGTGYAGEEYAWKQRVKDMTDALSQLQAAQAALANHLGLPQAAAAAEAPVPAVQPELPSSQAVDKAANAAQWLDDASKQVSAAQIRFDQAAGSASEQAAAYEKLNTALIERRDLLAQIEQFYKNQLQAPIPAGGAVAQAQDAQAQAESGLKAAMEAIRNQPGMEAPVAIEGEFGGGGFPGADKIAAEIKDQLQARRESLIASRDQLDANNAVTDSQEQHVANLRTILDLGRQIVATDERLVQVAKDKAGYEEAVKIDRDQLIAAQHQLASASQPPAAAPAPSHAEPGAPAASGAASPLADALHLHESLAAQIASAEAAFNASAGDDMAHRVESLKTILQLETERLGVAHEIGDLYRSVAAAAAVGPLAAAAKEDEAGRDRIQSQLDRIEKTLGERHRSGAVPQQHIHVKVEVPDSGASADAIARSIAPGIKKAIDAAMQKTADAISSQISLGASVGGGF